MIPAGATQLLLDVAGPVPFVIEGDTLASLADGNALTELEDGVFRVGSEPTDRRFW